MSMASDDEVRQASDQFYAALNSMLNGDAGPMGDIWSHEDDVSTMHPLGGRELGWDAVRASWEDAADAFSSGSVTLADLVVRIVGDAAYTLGVEHVDAAVGDTRIDSEFRVTNLYRREGGAWKMVHHHTDADAATQQALGLA